VAAHCLPERLRLKVAGNPGSAAAEWSVTSTR
jgi:hypothetical protein